MSFGPSFIALLLRGVPLLTAHSIRIVPNLLRFVNLFFGTGDPYRIRTDVNGVRGRCLNHLTNGPFGAPSGTRTRDPLIKSQLLYQLS